MAARFEADVDVGESERPGFKEVGIPEESVSFGRVARRSNDGRPHPGPSMIHPTWSRPVANSEASVARSEERVEKMCAKANPSRCWEQMVRFRLFARRGHVQCRNGPRSWLGCCRSSRCKRDARKQRIGRLRARQRLVRDVQMPILTAGLADHAGYLELRLGHDEPTKTKSRNATVDTADMVVRICVTRVAVFAWLFAPVPGLNMDGISLTAGCRESHQPQRGGTALYGSKGGQPGRLDRWEDTVGAR